MAFPPEAQPRSRLEASRLRLAQTCLHTDPLGSLMGGAGTPCSQGPGHPGERANSPPPHARSTCRRQQPPQLRSSLAPCAPVPPVRLRRTLPAAHRDAPRLGHALASGRGARFPEHGSGRGAGTGSTDLLPLPRNHADPLAGAEVRQDPGGRGLRLRSEQPGPRLAPAAAAATSRSTKAGGLEEFPLGRRSELRDPRGCQAPAPDLVAARGGGRLAEGHQDRLCFGS